MKNKVSIILLVAAVVIELIACAIWMAPIAGIINYPFVAGTAMILSIAGAIFAGKRKIVRVLSIILAIVILVTIIADVVLIVKMVILAIQ